MATKQRHVVIPAVYILFRRKGELLFMLRARTGYADGNYSLPAGHVDSNEPAAVAAAREAKEEVDVIVEPASLRLVHLQHRVSEGDSSERMNVFFEASAWQGEFANNEPHKCQELQWFATDNLPANIAPEVRLALVKMAEGHAYSELGFAAA